MRVTEALIRQSQQKKQRKDQDEEEALRYQDKKYEYWAINQQKEVYDSPFSGGFNTQESVFDKSALFKTQNK